MEGRVDVRATGPGLSPEDLGAGPCLAMDSLLEPQGSCPVLSGFPPSQPRL